MGRFNVILSCWCLAWILGSGLFAQENDWKARLNPADFEAYTPLSFFEEFKSDHYPEMAEINPSNWQQMKYVFNYLHNHGIPIGIGTNSNNHTVFELYLPLISRPDGLVGPTIGTARQSRVGNLYFLDHDSVHHAVGIPGVRRKDLENREAAFTKLYNIFLMKEQVATVHSMMDYIRIYWNWRDRYRHGLKREEFERLNQGMYSLGPMDADLYVQMIGDFVHGRSVSYGKTLAAQFSVKQMQEARRIGVPLPGPVLHPYVGVKAESWIYALLVPLVEPIASRFREVGYAGFRAYSKSMAEFMLQPWYVNWADDFQFGIPLDDLEKRGEEFLEAFKKNKPVGDAEAQPKETFEREFLKNEIALFGRRIAEVREMARRGHMEVHYTSDIDAALLRTYQKARALHQGVGALNGLPDSAQGLQLARDRLNRLMEEAQTLCPLETMLPVEHAHPFVDLSRYWFDMTALVVPRYGHNSGALSATDLKKFIRERQRSQESWLAQIRWRINEWFQGTEYGRSDTWRLQGAMADDYEAQQAAQNSRVAQERFHEGESVYLARLSELSQNVRTQIRKVIIPKISEVWGLSAEDRRRIGKALTEIELQALMSLNGLIHSYQQAFWESTPALSAKDFMKLERRTNLFLDRLYALLFEISRSADKDMNSVKIQQFAQRLNALVAEFGDLAFAPRTTLREEIPSIFPNRRFRWQAIFDGVTKLLSGSKPLMATVNELSVPYRLMRSGAQQSAKIIGWNPEEAKSSDGIYMLALNHDQGLLEVHMAYRVFQAAGIDRIFTLTTKTAWSLSPKSKNPEDAIFIEDDRPLERLIEKIQSSGSKRVGILVCPEGILPSLSVGMPIAAKPGAFVLARRLANRSELPVYFVQALFNGQEHLTSEKPAELILSLEHPELVPKGPVNPRDAWVENARLKFENAVNWVRGNRQADLVNPRKAPGTDHAVTGPVRPYLPFSKWFRGSVFKSCAAAVRKIHGLPEL